MKRSIYKYVAHAWALSLCIPTVGFASEKCTLEFEFRAVNEIGTIGPSDPLKGAMTFTVDREWQQGSETRSYYAKGSITLSGMGTGQVTGEVYVVHVVRTTHTWDYISIVAGKVHGDLGGETRYHDPMVFTLADKPGTLESFELPTSTEDWNHLSRTQKFQFHTPDANQIFYGTVTDVQGKCSEG